MILVKSDMTSTKMRVSCSHWHVFFFFAFFSYFSYYEKKKEIVLPSSFFPSPFFFILGNVLQFNRRHYYSPWTDGCHSRLFLITSATASAQTNYRLVLNKSTMTFETLRNSKSMNLEAWNIEIIIYTIFQIIVKWDYYWDCIEIIQIRLKT